MSDLPQALDRLETRLTSQLQTKATLESLGLLSRIRGYLVKPSDSLKIRIRPAATSQKDMKLDRILVDQPAIVGELPSEVTEAATSLIHLANSRMLNLGTLRSALRGLEAALKQHQPAVSPAIRIEEWQKR